MGKNKTTKRARLDFGLSLLITGGLSNIALWVGVFVATESQGPISLWIQSMILPVLGGISGLAMAFTVAAALIYILSKLADMKPSIERKVRGKDEYKTTPNYRYYTAGAAVIVLLLLSLALLSPYVYMSLAGKANLYAVMGDQWTGAWALGRVLAADIAIGAVALVRGVHLESGAAAGNAARTPTAAKSEKTNKARTPKTAAGIPTTSKTPAEMRPCDIAGCGIPYAWPNGKGGHFKKYHPELIIRKSIPVGLVASAPAEKES